MKRIILCADDYGQNEPISQAIIALLKKNRLSATSCMTTSASWPVHAPWLSDFHQTADIGLHFNLTEGKPLSQALLNSHGFMPLSKLIMYSYSGLLNSAAITEELHRQLDHFEKALGWLPDFVDGHQHIHQLPMIRDVLLQVYQERLQQQGSYIRCTYDIRPFSLKSKIIQLLGAGTLKRALLEKQIPHNSSFSGIYSFSKEQEYPRIFQQCLAGIQDRGIMMCHPGFAPIHDADVIAAARFREFCYFESEQFLLDCAKRGVGLGRWKNIC